MPETGPIVRADRQWGEELELFVTEQGLFRLADAINAATKAGAIYGQIIVPPEYAERKRNAMRGA